MGSVPSVSIPVGSGVSVGVPIRPYLPGEGGDITATREAGEEDRTARIGAGIKPIALIVLYGGDLNLFFNKDHGLEFQYLTGPGFLTRQDVAVMAVYYTRLISFSGKIRRYLSLGYAIGGPGIKFGVENGDYRGGNWVFEIGYPVVIGLGYVWYL